MIVITGRIKLSSSQDLSEVSAVLCRRAARSRSDNGNIEYSFSINIEDGYEIILVEKWQDQETLEQHLAIPDEEFGQLLANASIERAEVTAYEGGPGQILMQR